MFRWHFHEIFTNRETSRKDENLDRQLSINLEDHFVRVIGQDGESSR